MIYAIKNNYDNKKNCNTRYKNGSHMTKTFRSFKDFNVDMFVHDLKNVNWNIDDTMSVNIAWNIFVDNFNSVCDKHVPIKTIRIKQKVLPMVTSP